MVVTYTQSAINTQLDMLVRLGTIKDSLIIVQEIVTNDKGEQEYKYVVLDSADDIPTDGEGNPKYAYLNVGLTPTISISESGEELTFVLGFPSGTAAFYEGSGTSAVLDNYTIDNWSYGVMVTMNMNVVTDDDINTTIKVPDDTARQLSDFNSNEFAVSALFMDFQNTELETFDPTTTSVGDAGDVVRDQLVEFMKNYLVQVQESGNPYLLGYSIDSTDDTVYEEDKNVPAELRPASNRFTFYQDSEDADISNLNYVLDTVGGQGQITDQPAPFSSNWFSESDTCDGKMYYALDILVRTFILEPIYTSLKETVYDNIHKHVDVEEGNEYDDGVSELSSDGAAVGYTFTISSQDSGDDQYTNSYTATFENSSETQADIQFSGRIYVYKYEEEEVGCKATANASVEIKWSGITSITVTKDSEGEPVLNFNSSFTRDSFTPHQHYNDCAKDLQFVTELFSNFDDIGSFLGDTDWLTEAFDQSLDVAVGDLANILTLFNNLGNSITDNLLLPAGSEFFFSTPSLDGYGNFCLDLIFKTEY